jgi:8-oxo-dGTP diphosphatase
MKTEENRSFNIRVYGIVINNRNEVLITEERYNEIDMIKFPGGGLDYGEGTIDCLKREFMEEAGISVDVISHFYTTDYFQPSAFDNRQLISIYYLVSMNSDSRNFLTDEPKIKTETSKKLPVFRWVPLTELTPDLMTFPIDKIVAGMIGQGELT